VRKTNACPFSTAGSLSSTQVHSRGYERREEHVALLGVHSVE
jgi:hypothetical protein